MERNSTEAHQQLKSHPVSLLEVYKARECISGFIKPSALLSYQGLSNLLGCQAYVKHENQNVTGSFKIRGGVNLLAKIKQLGLPGVITFSTGNHGLSIAKAASLLGVPAMVVVPEGSNPVKVKLIEEAGATIIQAGRNFDESSLIVEQLSKEKGYYFAHPANEPHVINGVGTEFLEVMTELPKVDAVILPLGGGSEVASAVTVLKAINPDIEIYAVQAELSSAAYQSWQQNKIVEASNQTYAGGFATGAAYTTTFDIYKDHLTDFVLLSESEICQSTALAAHHTRSILEGAGSASIMAAWKLKERLAGKHVVLQFSGANASPEELNKAYVHPSFAHGQVE